MGATGVGTGTHLHLQVRRNNAAMGSGYYPTQQATLDNGFICPQAGGPNCNTEGFTAGTNGRPLIPYLSRSQATPNADNYDVFGIANAPLYAALPLRPTPTRTFHAIGVGGQRYANKAVANAFLCGEATLAAGSPPLTRTSADCRNPTDQQTFTADDYKFFAQSTEFGRGYGLKFAVVPPNSEIIDNDGRLVDTSGNTATANRAGWFTAAAAGSQEVPGYFLTARLFPELDTGKWARWFPTTPGMYQIFVHVPQKATATGVRYRLFLQGRPANGACAANDLLFPCLLTDVVNHKNTQDGWVRLQRAGQTSFFFPLALSTNPGHVELKGASITGGLAGVDAIKFIAAPPPLPPASLTATATANTQIRLGWQDKGSDELGFKIERRIGTGAWAQIAAVGANVTHFYSNGLSNSTTYSYRVRAHNANGHSAFSNIATAKTGGSLSKPAVPTALTAAAASASRIDLAWQDNSNNETGFYVERRVGTGTWSRIATLGANTTAYASGGLVGATTYGYRVQAYRTLIGTSAFSNEAQAKTPPGGGPRTPLNDTGIDWCANGSSNNLTCPVTDYPWQDAQDGRDKTHDNDSDGHAGFSFTKLAANGSALPANATSWSCVRDNVTGLIWEVKTDDGGLRDKDWTYSWYNPDAGTNGGSVGYSDWDNNCFNSARCDTHKFVADVNAAGLCGARDWRLPDPRELMSIVDNSRYSPSIDTAYFPRTESSWFWSSSPDADGSDYAWMVTFDDGSSGGVGSTYKDYDVHVRLVRGGQ